METKVNMGVRKIYKISDKFNDGDDVLLLAQVGYGEVCLISERDGNRLCDPIKVKDIDRITEEELYAMHSGRRIEHITDVEPELTSVELKLTPYELRVITGAMGKHNRGLEVYEDLKHICDEHKLDPR